MENILLMPKLDHPFKKGGPVLIHHDDQTEMYESTIRQLESDLEMYKAILKGVLDMVAKDKEDKKKGEVEEKEKNYRHIVLEEFAHKISQQEDLKPEFQEFINEHFWELI